MKRFKMSFVVREDKLATVMTVLAREVSEINISEVMNGERVVAGRTRKAMSETRSGRVALEALSSGAEVGLDIVAKKFEANSFAPTSASACLSALVSEGRVERVREGVYRRIG